MPSDLAHHSVIIGPAHPSPTFSFRKELGCELLLREVDGMIDE
jgi:hypothetical protein